MSLPKSDAVRPGDDLRPGIGSGGSFSLSPVHPPSSFAAVLVVSEMMWHEVARCALLADPANQDSEGRVVQRQADGRWPGEVAHPGR
jgi:hypothetical protein